MTKAAKIRQLREATSYSFTALVTRRNPEYKPGEPYNIQVTTEAESTVADHFAITKHVDSSNLWVITHTPSGYSVGIETTNKRLARLIAAIFGALPLDWGTTTTENSNERMSNVDALFPELKAWRNSLK